MHEVLGLGVTENVTQWQSRGGPERVGRTKGLRKTGVQGAFFPDRTKQPGWNACN